MHPADREVVRAAKRRPLSHAHFRRRIMQVYNVVRFKVKPGAEAAFLDAHRDGKAKWPGLEHGLILKTGEQTFCLIGTWSSQDAMVAARPAMIKTLDSFRSLLEDQGGGRGVTDAVSGPVALEL
jgi:quinol monooxygenase YgiN